MAIASEIRPAEVPIGGDVERRRPVALVGLVPLLAIPLLCLLLVALAARGPSFLAPTAIPHHFPSWMAGPLSSLWPGALPRPRPLRWLVSVTLGAMFVAYLLSTWSARRVNVRWIIGALVAVQIILFLSPPL